MNNSPDQTLVKAGDRDELKEFLRRRLVECGWRDEVKLICKEIIKENGQDITYDALCNAMMTQRAINRVPDIVKKELFQKIKKRLLAREEELKLT